MMNYRIVFLSILLSLYSLSSFSQNAPAIVADNEMTFQNTYLGYEVSAKVSVKYAQGNTRIVSPFIFVEGFNINPSKNEMSFEDFYTKQLDSLSGTKIKNEYDFIYVDWNNSQADICANALLLQDIINSINYNKHQGPGGGCKNVIVGHSMGGLIARLALTTMENDNQTHDTAFYVSYDSPHLGANIPVGAQFLLRDLSSVQSSNPLILSIKGVVNDFLPILDSRSARQMLYNFISPQKTLCNNVFDSMQSVLFSRGFPKGDRGCQIENLAISNGGYFSPSDSNVVFLNHQTAPDGAGLQYSAYCKISKDTGSGLIADARITRSIYNPFDNTTVSDTLYSSCYNSIATQPFVEAAPGSSVEIPDTIAKALRKNGIDSTSFKPIPFVPVASSLATGDYSRNHHSNPPEPLENTPFNAFCVYNSRQDHSLFYEDAWRWIKNQIDMKIESQNIVLTGDVLQMVRDSSDFSGIWSSSDTSVATIDPYSGYVSVVEPGMVTLSYSINGERNAPSFLKCRHVKRKRVLAGFPGIILTKYGGQGYYVVEASLVNPSLSHVVDSLVSVGELSYQWGVKYGNSNISWSTPTSDDSFSIAINNSQAINAYCRLCSVNGRVGSVSSIPIVYPSYSYFDFDPVSIRASFRGPIMNYQIFGSYPPFPSYINAQQLAIKFKSDYVFSGIPAPDNILLANTEELDINNTIQIEIDGISYTVYCFNIAESSYLESIIENLISTAQNGGNGGNGGIPLNSVLLPISIRSGTDELQTIGIPVSLGFNPIPLP